MKIILLPQDYTFIMFNPAGGLTGQMGSFEYPSADIGEPLDCYLHGYVSSRIVNLARAAEGEGLPVCIVASKVDGLVLSLTPNSHSYNYRSAILHGYAKR